VPIETSELDRLRQEYKEAVELLVAAIREEEALATPDHSVRAWDLWEQVGFKAEKLGKQAEVAKDAYIDGLRKVDFSF